MTDAELRAAGRHRSARLAYVREAHAKAVNRSGDQTASGEKSQALGMSFPNKYVNFPQAPI